jgi:O-antigen ligase/polysaccharide polymerase Wzy-like membrane protein/PDZ domain-containing protein
LLDNTAHDPPLQTSRRGSGPAKRLIEWFVGSLTSNIDPELPSRGKRVFVITQYIISFLLLMYAIFAPHSIALTQGAYLIGMGAWAVQLAATGRLNQKRSRVDIALFGFFACCVVSSFLSYVPIVSIKGLKSPAFFLAFYFVSNRVRSIRFAGFLALAMILSCLVNVGYSGVTLAKGRGLQINRINPDSPFANESIRTGDIIVEADSEQVNSPEALVRIIDSQRGRLRLKLQRKDTTTEASIPRQAIKEAGGVGFERLGIATSPGRNFRIAGFYSHYETYAEVLQLIAALAIGMLIAIPDKRAGTALFLSVVIPILAVTLILTSTRAALAGLAIGASVIALASSSRRIIVTVITSVVIVLPLALVAIEHSRGISVFDPEEGSTAYRIEVWREAFGIIKNNPLVGIGKGSEGKLKESLGLYDDGKLPPGHFHSTPVQIAVWWGLLGLIAYYSFMTIAILETWRLIKRVKSDRRWQLSGIALGGLGTIVAFNVSSFAHFNFGDAEVVMAFWLLTGLAFAVRRIAFEARADAQPGRTSAPPSANSSNRSRLPEQAAASESSVRAARAKPNL